MRRDSRSKRPRGERRDSRSQRPGGVRRDSRSQRPRGERRDRRSQRPRGVRRDSRSQRPRGVRPWKTLQTTHTPPHTHASPPLLDGLLQQLLLGQLVFVVLGDHLVHLCAVGLLHGVLVLGKHSTGSDTAQAQTQHRLRQLETAHTRSIKSMTNRIHPVRLWNRNE